MLAFVAPSHNSLRSLRSLCSNTCDESVDEAREYARGHESSASRRRKGALPATRPRLFRGTEVFVLRVSRCAEGHKERRFHAWQAAHSAVESLT